MENEAEKRISKFYTTVGWETKEGITEDAQRWEDLREHSKQYVSRCRLRVLRHIPDKGDNILDMASGPIQYDEYLEYSKNYKKRYCVDLSSQALDSAKQKIGNHGVFLCGSFFDIPFEENFFDCAISLHTIYHIDKDKQEEAVRKLVSVTKQGNPVIIVYRNPRTVYSIPERLIKKLLTLSFKKKKNSAKEPDLYFYAHPITWWNIFHDIADIQIVLFRSLSSDVQKVVIPNNKLGRIVFDLLFKIEDRFPAFFAKHFQYPMIILKKKVAMS
jgi:ubiquinone/menaquinone biosynthesis C-methylase UbiE